MARIKGNVSSTQLVGTFGVGALVAVSDESFIVAGLDHWDISRAKEIREPRLEKRLRVFSFRKPPASEGLEDVPVNRFPERYWCPKCKRLDEWRQFGAPYGGKSICNLCDDAGKLVPSRFVVACENGHLDDFPYYQWVHHNHPHPQSSSKRRAVLKINVGGVTSGLDDIRITCECGASRTMAGAFGKRALQGIARCWGKRPWLDSDDEECGLPLRALQRGASNVWFSTTQSAISIPPWSERAFRMLDRHWPIIKAIPVEALEATITTLNIADEEFTVDDLMATAQQRKLEGGPEETEPRKEEFSALVRNRPEKNREQEFVCVPAPDIDDETREIFNLVQQVKRLREVRALTGFTRLQPAANPESGQPKDKERIQILLENERTWLPAIEVTGEGVFLSLDTPRLRDWEKTSPAVKRAKKLDDNYKADCELTGQEPALEVTPRFVLIHTLAHALIDQWSLDSGYPAASLRERLYVSDEMAGVLIYTATTDSAGSLGGVVSMTEEGRLKESLKEALIRTSWCGQDPLCIESEAQGIGAINLAACHSCILIPETSCEQRNSFLDRAMLIGTPDTPSLGFFHDLVD